MDFDDYYKLLKAKLEAKDYEQDQEMPAEKKERKPRKLRQNEIFYTETKKSNSK
tara:strand:- start:413 stop:574 length:162 start_codon:yes stop_codon:yes gene_type:complete